MGFDGMFFGRADYQDVQTRNSTKTRKMVWKASATLGTSSWLFTGILPNGYSPPTSLCLDFRCSDPPVMVSRFEIIPYFPMNIYGLQDNPKLHDYNVPERVQTFIQTAHNEVCIFEKNSVIKQSVAFIYLQAAGYATNHIIMTMGSDFQYENALGTFKNLDKLMKYVNAQVTTLIFVQLSNHCFQQANGSNVNVFYSTPSCYLYALNKADRAWTSKSDDFFPYANHDHGYWTGYFTSRAALKGYERHSNNILQVTRQLAAFANLQARAAIFNLSKIRIQFPKKRT